MLYSCHAEVPAGVKLKKLTTEFTESTERGDELKRQYQSLTDIRAITAWFFSVISVLSVVNRPLQLTHRRFDANRADAGERGGGLLGEAGDPGQVFAPQAGVGE